jgi:6-phosphogluconate dehydrogenase
MQIGFVGLGRMGGNMTTRLRRDGHDVVGYDRDPARSHVPSLAELVESLTPPRAVWVMVPAGPATNGAVHALADLLEPGDLLVDGGNSRWSDDCTHAELLDAKGIGFVDAGVSGGVWGLENGYALMVGGSPEHVARVQPAFDSLKPSDGAGFVHAGPVGAGHFAKMVHNGIEYGLMQAYAEGYEMLEASSVVTDVPGVVRSWTSGTVIRSWLLELLVRALDEDSELDRLRGYVEDSGEGRWSVQEAVELAVPAPVMSAALFARFASRQPDSPAMRVVAALRHQFGGHGVQGGGGGDGAGGSS